MADPFSHRELTPHELRTYRILGVVAILAILALSFVHGRVDPTRIDPLPERAFVMVLVLAVTLLSYAYRRPQYMRAVYVAYGVITAWVLHLGVMNGFAADYALSLMVVVAGSAVVFRSRRGMAAYLLTMLALAIVATLVAARAAIHPMIFLADLVVISMIAYLTLLSHLRVQEELAVSEEQYRLAALGANDGLWDWDLETDRVTFSNRWKELLGHEPGELGDDPKEWFVRIHPEDRALFENTLETSKGDGSSHFSCEYRMRDRSGRFRRMLTRGTVVRDGSGRATRMAGSQTDITEQRRAEEQLVHDAMHDALTGLPNRSLFMDRLDRLISSRRRNGAVYAVIFLDLDRFKLVNDSYGHGAGDALLVETARRLESCLRDADTVARLSGDEFAILLDTLMEPTHATKVAERVLEELRAPFDLEGQETFVSASLGIAVGGPRYTRPVELLRDADTAMYRAKARGRGVYEVFDEAMHKEATALLALENDLQRSLEREEFELHFQPIVALDTGGLAGFEALVRWRRPGHGLVEPGQFVAAAEETGLIVPLGEWILHEACTTLSSWLREFPERRGLFVSVNLSARQFAQPKLLELVESALIEADLPPSSLRLEITESVVMADPPRAQELIETLRSRGVRLSIDDFGTGYSALSYLQQFRVDSLKIDSSFIARMAARGGPDEKLVRTIVGLAGSLGLPAVAEGIETEEQREHLRSFGCPFGQGYLFSKPVPSGDARFMVERGAIVRPDDQWAEASGHDEPTEGTSTDDPAAPPGEDPSGDVEPSSSVSSR